MGLEIKADFGKDQKTVYLVSGLPGDKSISFDTLEQVESGLKELGYDRDLIKRFVNNFRNNQNPDTNERTA
jgi:Holliday junction resolvasome RuvABC DNA-binding subunit